MAETQCRSIMVGCSKRSNLLVVAVVRLRTCPALAVHRHDRLRKLQLREIPGHTLSPRSFECVGGTASPFGALP